MLAFVSRLYYLLAMGYVVWKLYIFPLSGSFNREFWYEEVGLLNSSQSIFSTQAKVLATTIVR